jgi:hypothetical protein
MDTANVDRFEKLAGQLTGIYDELSLLSKKNPNDAVNKFKLKFINQQIAECNAFLTARYRPFDDFEQFSEDDVPQNSDVVFIVAQYLQCLEKLRADHVVARHGAWYWRVRGRKGDSVDENGFVFIRTSRPKHLRE